ncbi:MAG: GNAT family N-acetyltransferase [Pseudomonadota bacterium]
MTVPDQIRTGRLTLKPPVLEDAAAIVVAMSDFDVVRWLTRPPWPYTRADAEEFLSKNLNNGQVFMVHDSSGLVGCVGCSGEFGYWIAKPAWGRGYVTEAARAVLHHNFVNLGGDDLLSGHLSGNARSARVLDKLGFGPAPDRVVRSRALNRDVTIKGRILTRAAYFAGPDPAQP